MNYTHPTEADKHNALELSIVLWTHLANTGHAIKLKAIKEIGITEQLLFDCPLCETAKTLDASTVDCRECVMSPHWDIEDFKTEGAHSAWDRPCLRIGSLYSKWHQVSGPDREMKRKRRYFAELIKNRMVEVSGNPNV